MSIQRSIQVELLPTFSNLFGRRLVYVEFALIAIVRVAAVLGRKRV
jgi:hypothetical protein